jgi:hypothetical protein
MPETFAHSIVTILFQFTIVIVLCYSYKNGYFKTIVLQGRYAAAASVPEALQVDDSTTPFSLPSAVKFSGNLCKNVFSRCETLKPIGSLRNISSVIQEYKSELLPVTFSLPECGVRWNAFDWNLWNFTHSLWPILENVIESERRYSHRFSVSGGDEPTTGLFLISEENVDEPDEYEVDAKKEKKTLSFPDDFNSYSIKNEMLFWDFLYDLLPNRTVVLEENQQPLSSLDKCRYYSTNYRVFEGITQVIDLAMFCYFALLPFRVKMIRIGDLYKLYKK